MTFKSGRENFPTFYPEPGFPVPRVVLSMDHASEHRLCNLTHPVILRAIDDYSDVILVLLDLSATFDTLDH